MTVTIVAYKRPELLRQCLESIAKADLSPVDRFVFALDYHNADTMEQMAAVIRDYHPNRILYRTVQQFDRLGVANNTRAAYNAGFSVHGDEIVALEEDVTVAPDVFVFAQKMLQWSRFAPGYHFVNLCSHQTPLGSDPTKVHEDNELRGGYGWAFTREFWAYLEPRWNGKNRAPYGWDWNVSYLCYREKWRVLTPEVSRVAHTGREGTYCTPQWFDAHPQQVCTVTPERYELVKHELDYTLPEWVQAEMR